MAKVGRKPINPDKRKQTKCFRLSPSLIKKLDKVNKKGALIESLLTEHFKKDGKK